MFAVNSELYFALGVLIFNIISIEPDTLFLYIGYSFIKWDLNLLFFERHVDNTLHVECLLVSEE